MVSPGWAHLLTVAARVRVAYHQVVASDQLVIVNTGPGIASTNYWSSPAGRGGYLHLSPSAGALRILVPPTVEHLLGNLPKVGTSAEIANDRDSGRPVYRLVWLDDPTEPIVIDQQGIGDLPRAAVGRVVPLVWYVAAGETGVMERRREQVRISEVVTS